MAYTARSALNTRNGRLAYLPATAAAAAKTARQNASRIESAPRFSIVASASLFPATQTKRCTRIIYYLLPFVPRRERGSVTERRDESLHARQRRKPRHK